MLTAACECETEDVRKEMRTSCEVKDETTFEIVVTDDAAGKGEEEEVEDAGDEDMLLLGLNKVMFKDVTNVIEDKKEGEEKLMEGEEEGRVEEEREDEGEEVVLERGKEEMLEKGEEKVIFQRQKQRK
ncbi:uncharacterized protein MONOS_3387 [Monocercomonoides exilis]|uniref:uncharacterized protein n=1 Tax=Monocercomonoides exilis TaxID=2049356 RepID=UPI003559A46A|nr:hypothetical protein MONOS_3387 [Monocercomonoides exilis]|eukprot:MONOS_3387.1-p1 / transcript=MONOS_3387.1 / gene=MONOS_3387 / organism=Monocercomonoides_exilis_PA203 / gene_product=unspecified product / transcript_product=unspecified product / location=Mono_scaffold00079:98043-98911(+) / protein_length=128 / sequence_SO=supercontig / SO=protein_coding / is_pseudo=false